MPGLQGMTTQQRMEYAKEIYGIEFLPDPVSKPRVLRNLEGHKGDMINYTCGHCGKEVSGFVIAKNLRTEWLGCPSCSKGSVRRDRHVIPEPLLGESIEGLPPEVKTAYLEARTSFSHKCYTACELMCRKLLMNVAVHQGDGKDKRFADYVDYLTYNGYVVTTRKNIAKQIKDNGNKATHEINPSNYNRAKATLQFTAYILKGVYEI